MRRMATKLFLLLFVLLSVMVSCNQNMMAVGTAARNFVTAPYRGVRDMIANNAYQRAVRRTERAHGNVPDIYRSTCDRQPIEDILDPDDEDEIEGLLPVVRDSVCSCKAWGSCSANECSCENLCPKTLELLQRTENISDLSSEDNSLSFRNSQVQGAEHEMTQGFCWGHASLTSKFNRLAFFEPNQDPHFDLNAASEEEQNQALDYYKEQIDKIVDNKVAEFPGISNLNELSRYPGLQTYLFDRMGELWADNAMTFQGLFTSLKSTPQSREDNEEFFRDVKRKIDNHEQPQIVFTRNNAKFMTHAVLVSHYIQEGDQTILCIRDNNYGAQSNQNCENRMTMNTDGSVNYESSNPYNFDWGKLGGLKIAHNDNREAVTQMNRLHKKCEDDKGCN